MTKLLKFCKNCIDRPESEYIIFGAGEVMWEGQMCGHSAFYCSKCEKEFKIGEKMFVPRLEFTKNNFVENKIEKCKLCGNEDKKQLVHSLSIDEDGDKYVDGYICLECSTKTEDKSAGDT
ncbi:MAG: hypothetical protein PHW73_09115 [Atribacterota bacterium]|nr:hypothetical protein [Atribacterota bacterium]